MSDKDTFELDVEETADEEFDDVSLDEGVEETAESAPKKKKSGGGAVIFVLLLAVLGGGSFAAVKFLGVQLPFDVPGLTQQAAQQPPAAQPPAQMTTSADLPAADLPPQPEVAVDSFSPMNNLPASLTSAQQEEATISAPWATEETAPVAGQIPGETASVTPDAVDGDNIVDPFAFDQQDVTAEVNAAPTTVQTQPESSAPEAAEIVDPFASVTAAAPAPSPAPETSPAPAVTAAPAEDPAAKAKLADLEKKLAETEKSLAASEKALKKANDDLAKKSEELAKAQADLKATQKAAKAAESKPAAVATKPAAEQTAKPANKTATKPAAPVRKIEWVLRSAKPGMAWVSEKGSNEMRTIGVGDTLAGIGKVTAITTDAQGRWVVNGTRGTINQ